MTLAVLVVSSAGHKQVYPGLHVHGLRDGRLLLASGEPGGGLGAVVEHELELSDVRYVETVEHDDDSEDETDDESGARSTWRMER